MHERERHRIILSAVQEKPVITIQDLVELTEASEATLRRDIASLHMQGPYQARAWWRRGYSSAAVRQSCGPSFQGFESENADCKRAIAREAVALCEEGDSIIINGGSTTFQMVHYLAPRRLQVLTNSFAIAEHLLHQSKSTVIVPGGAIYRDQSLILSPFDNDVIRNFYGRRMFMGCQGISPLGVMESDALIIQSEQKLMGRADELVLMVDSTKFTRRSSLILCPLDRVSTLITDDGISDEARRMVENAGIRLIVAQVSANAGKGDPREDSAEVA